MPPCALLRRAPLVAGLVVGASLVVLGAGEAHAGTSLQAQLTLSAGVTDNVTGAQNDPLPGTRGRQTDLIVSIDPSLILSTGTSRVQQRLQYTFGGIIYARNSDADTYTNTLSWGGFFIPSKTTLMNLNLGISQSRLSAFNTALDTSTTQPQIVRTGSNNILSINAGQSLSWEMTAHWRFNQSVGFGSSYIIDARPPQATTRSVPVHVGVERSFARDTLGIDAAVTYSDFPEQRGPAVDKFGRIDPDGVVSPRQGQMIASPLVRWRRDLTYFLSSRLELGAIVVFDPSAPEKKLVEPAGGIGLNFFHKLTLFDLSYNHGASPNLLFRANFLTDTAALRAQFLLGQKSGFTLSLSAGYSYQRQLDTSANVLAVGQSVAGDITLAWAPRPILSFFLRYQLLYQIGRDTDPQPLPSYYRNTLLFGLSAIYPAESAADVPSSTRGFRADGRDQPGITSSKSTPR